MVAVSSGEGLVLLEFADRRMLPAQLERVRRLFPGSPIRPGKSGHADRIRDELGEWFAGERRSFATPLIRRGSPFQQAAWAALDRIPYGATRSYQQQAATLGRPGAERAVGRANGDNRLAIVIPCHRVIRADGSHGGYGGGLWRKQRLLGIEQAHAVRAAR